MNKIESLSTPSSLLINKLQVPNPLEDDNFIAPSKSEIFYDQRDLNESKSHKREVSILQDKQLLEESEKSKYEKQEEKQKVKIQEEEKEEQPQRYLISQLNFDQDNQRQDQSRKSQFRKTTSQRSLLRSQQLDDHELDNKEIKEGQNILLLSGQNSIVKKEREKMNRLQENSDSKPGSPRYNFRLAQSQELRDYQGKNQKKSPSKREVNSDSDESGNKHKKSLQDLKQSKSDSSLSRIESPLKRSNIKDRIDEMDEFAKKKNKKRNSSSSSKQRRKSQSQKNQSRSGSGSDDKQNDHNGRSLGRRLTRLDMSREELEKEERRAAHKQIFGNSQQRDSSDEQKEKRKQKKDSESESESEEQIMRKKVYQQQYSNQQQDSDKSEDSDRHKHKKKDDKKKKKHQKSQSQEDSEDKQDKSSEDEADESEDYNSSQHHNQKKKKKDQQKQKQNQKSQKYSSDQQQEDQDNSDEDDSDQSGKKKHKKQQKKKAKKGREDSDDDDEQEQESSIDQDDSDNEKKHQKKHKIQKKSSQYSSDSDQQKQKHQQKSRSSSSSEEEEEEEESDSGSDQKSKKKNRRQKSSSENESESSSDNNSTQLKVKKDSRSSLKRSKSQKSNLSRSGSSSELTKSSKSIRIDWMKMSYSQIRKLTQQKKALMLQEKLQAMRNKELEKKEKYRSSSSSSPSSPASSVGSKDSQEKIRKEKEKEKKKEKKKQKRRGSASSSTSIDSSLLISQNQGLVHEIIQQRGRQFSDKEVTDFIDKIRKDCERYCQEEDISMRTLFRRMDMEDDGCLTFMEFQRCFQQYFKSLMLLDTEGIEEIFDDFNQNKDDQISFDQFVGRIYGQKRLDVNQLVGKLKVRLSINEKQELQHFFNEIDMNHDKKINYYEFVSAIRKLDLIFNSKEMEALFQFFDQKGNGEVQYESFMSIIFEEHLRLEHIQTQILKYLGSEKVTLREVFESVLPQKHKEYNRLKVSISELAKGEDKKRENEERDEQEYKKFELNTERFQNFLKKTGLSFDIQQIEQMIDVLDLDQNGQVHYDELFQFLYRDIKINLNKALIKTRRDLIQKGIDIGFELRKFDSKNDGTVDYGTYMKVMRGYVGEAVSNLQLESIFQRCDPYNERRIFINTLVNQLLSVMYDITQIRHRIMEFSKQRGLSPRDTFLLFDNDKTGLVQFEQFDKMLGALNIQLSDDQLREAFEAFDYDGSGKLKFEEFQNVVQGVNVGTNANFQKLIQLKEKQRTRLTGDVDSLLKKKGFYSAVEKRDQHLEKKEEQFRRNQEKFVQIFIVEVEGPPSPPFPGHFEEKCVLENITFMCIVQNKDPFDVFLSFDSEYLLKYNFLKQLKLSIDSICGDDFLTVQHLHKVWFLHFDQTEKQFNYLQLLKKIIKPAHLILKAMHYYMTFSLMSPQIFFRQIQMNTQNDSEFWYIIELETFCEYIQLEYSFQALLQVWREWDPQDQRKLELNDLCRILGVSRDYVPESKVTFQKQAVTVQYFETISDQLKKYLVSEKLNLMDIFIYFDKTSSMYLKSAEELYQILVFIDFDIDLEETQIFFNYFRDQAGFADTVSICMALSSEYETLKSLLLGFMRKFTLSFKGLLKKFSSREDSQWTYSDFLDVLRTFRISTNQKTARPLFLYFLQSSNKKIICDDLARVYSLNPALNGNQIKDYYTQQLGQVVGYLQQQKEYKRKYKFTERLKQEKKKRLQSIAEKEKRLSGNFIEDDYSPGLELMNVAEPEKLTDDVKDVIRQLEVYLPHQPEYSKYQIDAILAEFQDRLRLYGVQVFKAFAQQDALNYQELHNALVFGYYYDIFSRDLLFLTRKFTADGPVKIEDLEKFI